MRRNTLVLGVLLPVLSAVSLIAGAWTIASTMRGSTRNEPQRSPLEAPWPDTVAGTGVVEPSSQTVLVATPLAGIVSRVNVVAGATVRKGDELFAIDDRSFAAQQVQGVANTAMAEAGLRYAERTRDMQAAVIAQRRADIGGVVADRKRAEQDRQRNLSLVDIGGASRQSLESATADAEISTARLETATAALLQEVTRLKVLAAQVEQAKAKLDVAAAQQRVAQVDLERTVIRAPLDGTVLQVGLRRGEYIVPGRSDAIQMGAISPFHIRAEFDQVDAQRIKFSSPAVARVRGGTGLAIPMHFVRFEPLLVAKSNLVDGRTEVVDTRVLQVIYALAPETMPVYVGQIMDVMVGGADGASQQSR